MTHHPARRLLAAAALAVLAVLTPGGRTHAAPEPEKPDLKLGFIKLTDCVPLVIAKEKGFFEDEGLYVVTEAQANWKILLDRVISGELDAAHMLAGQPIAATVGFGTRADIITPVSLDLNGNGVTVSKEIWERMLAATPALRATPTPRPVKADALRPIVQEFKASGSPLRLGMVFPVSTHNYELRYWLAAGGIHPGFYTASDINGNTGADVLISVTPPPQMPATLAQGTIQGYCVGEPWNQQAVLRGIGVSVVTDHEIWNHNPEKVLGLRRDWAEKHPRTTLALTKAVIRACRWLDEKPEHRVEACRILARPEYVGADFQVIANSMTGTWEYFPGDKRELADFNVFFRHFASYPFYSDCVWYLTQMRRWGQIGEAKPDDWYAETARKVYRPDLYLAAARELVAEGHLKPAEIPETDGFKAPTSAFIDGVEYDGRKPNAYLRTLAIGNRD